MNTEIQTAIWAARYDFQKGETAEYNPYPRESAQGKAYAAEIEKLWDNDLSDLKNLMGF
jgi:hypothetical protein